MIEEFERHLRGTNLSENTISSYLFAIRQYSSQYDGITKKNLRAYKVWLIENYKPKSVNLRLRALNCYLESIGKESWKMPFVRVQQKAFLENVISEANQKAEEIIHRANLRGDDIIRDANELLQKANDRADEIENEANEKRLAEEREYDRVRLEVTRFKSDVLNLYRSHVESLSRLPEFQKETPAQEAADAEPAADEAEPAAAAQLQAADVQPEAEPVPAAEEDAEPAASAEDDSKAADSSEDFWAKDESQLKLDPPPAPPADFKPDEPDYDAFQGVKFSE